MSLCAQLSSRTWPRLRSRDRLGLSVLAQGHDEVALSLAAKEGDRFAAVDWEATPQGGVVVHGASAWLQYKVYEEITAGDHLLVLLEVVGLETRADSQLRQAHGLGYLGWPYSGNGGVTNFDPAQLTSWSQRIFNGANGIRETTREATVHGARCGPGTPLAET